MSITLTDSATIHRAERLAALTGRDVESAIGQSLEKALGEAERDAEIERKAERLMAIGQRFAARLGPPMHSSDIDALLYGEDGLPR